MPSQADLIRGCIERDPHLMEQFYKHFAPEMWVVCLRYTRNVMTAEDVMQEGFIRAFETIGTFTGAGSFQGWLRRVFVTSAINHFKKYYRFEKQETDLSYVPGIKYAENADVLSKMSADEMMDLLKTLPDGYRMVFNLYAIEGYSHKEIAEMLGCTEGTSRSQLLRARAQLMGKIGSMEHQAPVEKEKVVQNQG
ncbi:MAG TPA: sigma-70 family RNA polymerase sigma factor [Bacteroidales bacterium]|nr:sigma-70 family RNA polymerase sigma factor [Bacteroidales bacterium]HRZ48256.1 sigma-70 family RNA polymerase sigma factor [Bacteroidales bacterium]